MTLNEAIMELVVLHEHPMMPGFFKPGIQHVIETISELDEPDRKTGRWIKDEKDERFVRCSCCGLTTTTNELMGIALFGDSEPYFCPACGAMMREKDHG